MIQTIIDFVREQLANNDLAQGGLIIGAGAAIMAYLRAVPNLIWRGFVYHCTVEIDIPDNEAAFQWVTQWLAQHKYSKKRARRLTVANAHRQDEADWITTMSPAPGRHYLWDQGRFLIITRRRKELQNATHSKAFAESISIRVIGRNRQPALNLIARARKAAKPAQKRLWVHQSCDRGFWDTICSRRPRALQSVIALSRDQILDDARDFIDSQEWYHERGIPYRRGYLFYGTPGNGKTSMILVMASELEYNIGILNLRDLEDDYALSKAVRSLSSRSLLVIEDIDCLFEDRDSKVKVSFAGLLNALDGLGSKEGIILVMTTNRRECLDEALIRPGRVDMEVEFKDATPATATALFRNFYPDGNARFFESEFRRRQTPISMAALQGIFIRNKDDDISAARAL